MADIDSLENLLKLLFFLPREVYMHATFYIY